MAKKFKKTIQKVETAKISEVYKKEDNSTIDDLKIKLLGVENKDELSDLKNKIFIDDNDPLYNLKKMLTIDSDDKEDIIENVLEEYSNEIIHEEDVIEDLVLIEKEEEKIEIEIKENIINDEKEKNILSNTINEELKYFYNFHDSVNNNILTRSVEKKKNEKIVIHIALNNLDFDLYNNLTKTPFEIYHNENKILDFYQFKNDNSLSYNFKNDIYILKSNLVIDSKTYPLCEVRFININFIN